MKAAAATLAALALAWGVADNAGAQTAPATSTHLVIHGLSHHAHARPNGQPWNEVNIGAGLRRDIAGDLSGQVGFYRNSINRTSTYALLDVTPLHLGPVSAGGFIGAASGYVQTVRPIAGAVLRVDAGRFTPTLRLIPKVPGNKSASVSLELGVRF
jgi:hypothetical protein